MGAVTDALRLFVATFDYQIRFDASMEVEIPFSQETPIFYSHGSCSISFFGVLVYVRDGFEDV